MATVEHVPCVQNASPIDHSIKADEHIVAEPELERKGRQKKNKASTTATAAEEARPKRQLRINPRYDDSLETAWVITKRAKQARAWGKLVSSSSMPSSTATTSKPGEATVPDVVCLACIGKHRPHTCGKKLRRHRWSKAHRQVQALAAAASEGDPPASYDDDFEALYATDELYDPLAPGLVLD
jgi:hypothetical protein